MSEQKYIFHSFIFNVRKGEKALFHRENKNLYKVPTRRADKEN